MAVTRRTFLKAGLAQGAVAMLAGPSLIGFAKAADPPAGLCVTICNHWSYIGIGWQLGIESCVLSATDAMELADRPPHAKTCLNLGARAYELMAEKFPEVAERLKRQLAADKVELIGGTYGQPMGTTISGESNIRQIVVGRETIHQALGYEMVTFLEEEEFTHPQVPQLAALAGFRYASLAQLDTWGRAGCPRHEFNVIAWKGMDGTTIPCVPKNSLFGYSADLKKLMESLSFKKLQALGKPLLFTWEEFGWESPEQPAYLTAPARYKALADEQPVEFVTLKDYLDQYGAGPQETISLAMDAWNKSLTWGLGGDQVRILDRKVEGLLLAAEMFDALASTLGAPSGAGHLAEAWRHLLASQSHDVGWCEYSRWQGDRMAPADRLEDYHNFTWGTIGYNHLDAARQQAQPLLEASLKHIAARINSRAGQRGSMAITVFNPLGWLRTDAVATGRIYPLPPATRGLVVRNRSGQAVPSQIVTSAKDSDGNLLVAEVAFLSTKLPSAGYDTYYLECSPQAVLPSTTGLKVEESSLVMENEHLRVRLDPATGGVAALVHKPSGREMLDGDGVAFPRLTGRPNPILSRKPNPPAFYDTAKSKAQIDWVGNLVMREWESHFTREYGWPIYAEYRYGLMPHGLERNNSDRLRAAGAFGRPALCVVAQPQPDELPQRKSFLDVGPDGVQLFALRRKSDGNLELRVVEVEGRRHQAALTLGFPASAGTETNLIGARLADAPLNDDALRFAIEPWKIRTFALR